MKYFILAGEASGDLHSAALAKALKEKDPAAELYGWGGDEMTKAGVKILKHYRELAFMGFVEVLQHLPQIIRNFRQIKTQLSEIRPDVLILTDYPGFNLRMAKWAYRQGIPVHYYISPQLWAWKESRVKTVRKYVKKMYVILPFEKAFYATHGIDVHYVGHPLAWRIKNLTALEERRRGVAGSTSLPADRHGVLSANPIADKPVIALLPGSRKREITNMLPTMLEAVKALNGYRVFVAGAPSVEPALYDQMIVESQVPFVTITYGYTYRLLSRAYAALCASGTATLETALFNVPQVVCYKGDRLSYLIARHLVKVPFIAMVNLICGKAVVKELIQDDFNPERLRLELNAILDHDNRNTIRREYATLRERLGSGDPAQRVAELIVTSTPAH